MYARLKTPVLRYTGALLSLSLLATGCSSLYGWSNIHKSAKGMVYVKEVADWSFEANHPAQIDQATLLSAIKGVVADEATKQSMKMPASGSKPMRVFSDEDAEFLAPLLAHGLSQAKPEQIVGFTVSPSAGSGEEPVAGTIYASQNSLYLTIAPTRNKKVSGFVPSAAARIERAPSYAAQGAPGTLAIVIDHQVLAKGQTPTAIPVAAASELPPASGTPATQAATSTFKPEAPAAAQAFVVNTPAASGDPMAPAISNDELLNKKLDELRQMRETSKMKDSELAMLKREVEWMKRELRERTAELKAAKASAASGRLAPKKKPAEAYRTR
jgi:hypothetical protein